MSEKKPSLPPEVPWTPITGIAFFALLLILSAFAGLLFFAFGAHQELYLHAFFSHGGVLLFVFLYLRHVAGSFSRMKKLCALHMISPPRFFRAALIPAFITLAALFIWFLVHAVLRDLAGYRILEQPQVQWLREQRLAGGGFQLYTALFIIIILAPLAEELIFRMLIYFPVRQRIGRAKAILWVSLLFAVLHVHTIGTTLEFLMNAVLITGHLFIVSVFFTVLLERTRTLLAPVAGHVIYNAAVVSLVLWGVA